MSLSVFPNFLSTLGSQGESELVAKDDNLDAADPNKDKKTQDKDDQMDVEEKEKINEQGDEVILLWSDEIMNRSNCPPRVAFR